MQLGYLNKPRIIYLIIASRDREHERDCLVQKSTWATEDISHVFWLRGGGASRFELIDRDLFVPCQELYGNILKKTLLGISWLVDNMDFDFVFRTNVSTYVDTKKLTEFIYENKLTSDSVSGYVEVMKKERNNGSFSKEGFLSGTGILLGKNIALELIRHGETLEDSAPDDVTISRYLRRMGVTPHHLPRSNIHSTHLYFPAPFTRCKSSTNEYATSRRMYLIDEIVTKGFFRKLIAYLRLIGFESFLILSKPELYKSELKRFLVSLKRSLKKKDNLWI